MKNMDELKETYNKYITAKKVAENILDRGFVDPKVEADDVAFESAYKEETDAWTRLSGIIQETCGMSKGAADYLVINHPERIEAAMKGVEL